MHPLLLDANISCEARRRPGFLEEPTMPYLHLDLAKTYSSETKQELAKRLCRLYANVMQTQLWRPNDAGQHLP
jgi:hypothetical protein